MQLNMSFVISFFKRLFSGKHEEKTPEVQAVVIKPTPPSTPITSMANEIKEEPLVEPTEKAQITAISKAKTTAKAKPSPKTKIETKTAVNSKSAAKKIINAKNVPNIIPQTIVLDEAESRLTIKNKRIVGHCKKSPQSFVVTHIVKPEQEKLRINLALTGWKNVEGLSFVTYDIANDAIIFSKACADKIAAELNDVLLAWARKLNENYYR